MIVWTRHHHVELSGEIRRLAPPDLGDRPQEQIGTFFHMHSAKKQQAFLAPQFRKFFQKQNSLPHRITHRSRGAVVHDRFAATVEPKRFPGAHALFLAGK